VIISPAAEYNGPWNVEVEQCVAMRLPRASTAGYFTSSSPHWPQPRRLQSMS